MPRPRYTLRRFLETWPYASILNLLSARVLTTRDLGYLVLGRLSPQGRGRLTIDPTGDPAGSPPPGRATPSSQAFGNYLQRLKRGGWIRRRRDGGWELMCHPIRHALGQEAHLEFLGTSPRALAWASLDGQVVLHGCRIDSPPTGSGPGTLAALGAVHDLQRAADRLWGLLRSGDPVVSDLRRRQADLLGALDRRAGELGLVDRLAWCQGFDQRRSLLASDPELLRMARELDAIQVALHGRTLAISVMAPRSPLGPPSQPPVVEEMGSAPLVT